MGHQTAKASSEAAVNLDERLDQLIAESEGSFGIYERSGRL